MTLIYIFPPLRTPAGILRGLFEQIVEFGAERASRAGNRPRRSLAPLRRRHDLLGTRRDGEGPCGDPGDGRAEEAAAKLTGAVAAAIADPAEAQWVDRHVRPLVGLAADVELGGGRRSEAFAAWRRFFEALAERYPLVLVFEDLQWADDDLFDFVDYLVE